SAARASVLRYGFILIGLTGAITILVLYQAEATQPVNYVQDGSYNRSASSLFIHGMNQTYAVEPGTTIVNLDGKPVSTDYLDGRYEVLARTTVDRRSGGRTVKVLTLVEMRSIAGKITRRQAHEFLLGAIIVEVAVI